MNLIKSFLDRYTLQRELVHSALDYYAEFYSTYFCTDAPSSKNEPFSKKTQICENGRKGPPKKWIAELGFLRTF